jgi:hypothetical protein
MDPFAVSHFSDNALLHELKTLVAQDCRATAVLLTRIAEVDERRLYRREGYPSMREYCLHELHFSEGVTYKRINAARAAREYPAVLVAVAEGRLHLSGVLALAPRLTPGNADELVAAATHKTRAEIELLLAERFPRPDLPERLQAIPTPPWATLPAATPQNDQLAPGQVDASTIFMQSAGNPIQVLSQGNVGAPAPPSRVMPLAPQRFGFQCTLDRETFDLMQRARELMGHQNPSGEFVPVIKRGLEMLVGHLEKQKFAATTRPGHSRGCTSARRIPAAVKRAVRERDGEQCAFVSDSGKRCTARTMLEFDHLEPIARGGVTTADNVRLLCRAHNQYAAERAFGADYIDRKRREARERAATGRVRE